MSGFDVAVAGELNLDLVLEGLPPELPLERELLATGFSMTLGSSSAIFAHNLACLGLKVTFAGLVGADDFGRIALDYLRSANVDTQQVSEAQDGTATGVTVLLPHGGARHILSYPGTMERFTVDDVSVEALAAARHFHLSSLFLQRGLHRGLPELLRALHTRGLSISLDTNDDPAGAWGGVLDEVLPFVDILLPNRDEACRMTHKQDLGEALDVLSAIVPVIVVKCGPEGALVVEHGSRTVVPGITVQAHDRIGAGDSFNAGFLAARLSGESVRESARAGNIAGALSTTRAGGVEAFRHASEREQFLAQHHFPRTRRANHLVTGDADPASAALRERSAAELARRPFRSSNG
jgi:sugar/nucleoside kinase (ribokinase family)